MSTIPETNTQSTASENEDAFFEVQAVGDALPAGIAIRLVLSNSETEMFGGALGPEFGKLLKLDTMILDVETERRVLPIDVTRFNVHARKGDGTPCAVEAATAIAGKIFEPLSGYRIATPVQAGKAPG